MHAGMERMRFVDTHAHLHSTVERMKLPSFAELQTAMAAHVEGEKMFELEAIVNVYCETEELVPGHPSHSLLEEKNIFGAFGNHPHHGSKWSQEVEDNLRLTIKHRKCVALGECGLDYHYMSSPKEQQIAAFKRQCEIAVEVGLPLVVHSREAEEDTIAILKQVMPRDWHIHVHCFTSSSDMARQLLEHFSNLYIGITGVVTFRKGSEAIVATVKTIPLNRLLVETDAPFMTPHPYRGKSACHSGHALHTARVICALKEVEEREGFKRLRDNAVAMYRLPLD